MIYNRTTDYLESLVRELCSLPSETEWVEFKRNDCDPHEIGEYISAVGNSAALAGKTQGFVVWGIEDGTHEIVGTAFRPSHSKVGNEELESWLLRLLEPKINFRFHEIQIGESPIVILEVERASRHPVRFDGQEYIRIGTYKKKLKDFQEKERELWRVFDRTPFENLIAVDNLEIADVLRLLESDAYFKLLDVPMPPNGRAVVASLANDRCVVKMENGRWGITNLGALLFARNLSEFHTITRKATRVIRYQGDTRIIAEREHVERRGYANGFENLLNVVDLFLPSGEVIGTAARRTTPTYPPLAVREVLANALIHQDLSVTGAGPIVEVFDNRVEITNPGLPLVSTPRLLDSPPRSRNESLASLMRRIGYCEERGGGVDKVVFETEFHQLPAPIFEEAGDNFRVVLFGPRSAGRMDKADRVRACYWHACLKYVNRDYLTNSSIRERFAISSENNSVASRYIREAVQAGEIKPFDEAAAPRLRKYVPYWATSSS